MCDQKPTRVRLIYNTEQQQWRTGKLKRKKRICSEVLVNSPWNPWSQSERRKGRLRWEGFAEKKSLEWKSEGIMDDESGESMELMEEMPLKELGDVELERLVRGWRREARSWFQRRGEAYWNNDLLFVEKMMWMDERVWPKMKSESREEAERWWGYAEMKVWWLWELCV